MHTYLVDNKIIICVKKYIYLILRYIKSILHILGGNGMSEVKVYGYHRASTKQQHLDRGIEEINKFCSDNDLVLDRIFSDKCTGKNFERKEYKALRDVVLRSGDTLIVTEVDRLGRNKEATLQELQYLKEKNIRVMILELPTTCQNLSSLENNLSNMMLETINNMLIELYATLAHAEMEKRVKRQKEGIEQMKQRGEWDNYGRPRKININEFSKAYERVRNKEIRNCDLMRQLNLKPSTYYRYIKEIKENF